MMREFVSVFLVVGICSVLIGYGSVATADEKADVNKFYKSAVQAIKKPVHLSELLDLVKRNPAIAKRCVEVCGEKAQVPGKQGEALAIIRDELQAALVLSSHSTKCDENCARYALEMTRQEPDADARIALLKRLVHACPQVGQAFAELGDLYFKQNRWGETIAAYKSAVELTGDEGVRDRLEKAVQQDAKFVKNARLQPADVKGLFSGEYDVVISTMGPGGIVIKARVVDSIQRQVRFDEWSARIKGHFLPDLKVIGQGLKEQLPKHADVRLLIEGHTDKRGPVDRNMKLSKDRAEAIKNYLVQNYGIDPARLATEGYGPTRPYSPEETDKGYALNRRVEFKKIQ